MMSLYLIFGAGLFGVFGHWVTRWAQGRTQSSLFHYLMAYKANTMSSFFANIASSGVIYSSTPEDISGRALVLVVLGAYAAGYTLDSKINKDESTSDLLLKEKLCALKYEESSHAKKNLADVLRDDANL